MNSLQHLPEVGSFFGVDLKTGSMIIAALGVVHPMAYGCTFFIPLSYLLVTIWILVALFFAASIVLFFVTIYFILVVNSHRKTLSVTSFINHDSAD
ncbi:uncharacterized protein LOC120631776 [Pararge aegeria]|uniref:uncharacterized protein LOC120631776 n=1 Tax=Pararge aegeria TaxID=116150 RepID=UPI0019D05F12|nr:uncharacterized protein LOC120631776 [Pararge aegeria]